MGRSASSELYCVSCVTKILVGNLKCQKKRENIDKTLNTMTKPKKESDKLPTGRPTGYKPEYDEQARKLCALGATDAELANFFEVVVSTINLWKIKFPSLSESLKVGKEKADDRVENSLYHRAMGYSHPEDDIRVVNGEIVVTPTIKHYPPDTTAMIFWLKNRRSPEWRDKVTQEHSGPNGEAIEQNLTLNVVFKKP